MSNSYTKAAFCILMSPADATMLSLAVKAIDILDTGSDDEDLKLSFDALGVRFGEVFPAKGPNAFGSFLDLIDDPAHPSLGCDIDIEEPDTEGRCAVTFSGEQVEVEAVARLIFTACKSALPCAFEWAHGMDRLRVGEFGGGCVVITVAGIDYHNTRDILDRAITRTIAESDEAVDGFLLALADQEHGLSFWNNDHGFGRLGLATVFSEDEAARFDKPIAHSEPEWLAMPAPLAFS